MVGSPISSIESDPADTGLEPAGDGKMWMDRQVHSRLQQAGMSAFEDVMGTSDGCCLRALKDRENWHLQLHDDHRQPRGVYLKKHHVRTLRSVLWAKFGSGPAQSAGRIEAENVGRMSADGIAVMKLLAYGEKLHADGLLESFVLTEELQGYIELHYFLRRRFARCASNSTRKTRRELGRLIRLVAETARRLHTAGYNHRDLYCCHFFVKEVAVGKFDVKLIDLQRVQYRRRFRRRWLVKDLAQLAWSIPRECVRCTDRIAFMRHYLGVRKLRAADKRLIREVMAKQQVLARRLGVEE